MHKYRKNKMGASDTSPRPRKREEDKNTERTQTGEQQGKHQRVRGTCYGMRPRNIKACE